MRFRIGKHIITIFEYTNFDRIVKESIEQNKTVLDALAALDKKMREKEDGNN